MPINPAMDESTATAAAVGNRQLPAVLKTKQEKGIFSLENFSST